MQDFNITVWYRYVSRGNQEKDFNVHTIKSNDPQEAVNKASDLYKNLKEIPFEFSYQGHKYAPNNFDKKFIVNGS